MVENRCAFAGASGLAFDQLGRAVVLAAARFHVGHILFCGLVSLAGEQCSLAVSLTRRLASPKRIFEKSGFDQGLRASR